jgi:hypothetical protein
VRLADLLRHAVADPNAVDREAYEQFRSGLLRHMAMEEKILLPEARRLRGDDPLPVAKQLRADHAALAALLVPSPTHGIITTIGSILDVHDRLEEDSEGLYPACEELPGADVEAILVRLRAVPEVPVAPHLDSPRVHEHIAKLLRTRTTPSDVSNATHRAQPESIARPARKRWRFFRWGAGE